MIKRLAAILTGFSLLICSAGCDKTSNTQQNDFETIRNEYVNSPGVKAECQILSNLNERTLEYVISYAYNKESGGKIEIISPEEISGISADIEQDTYTLNYNGTSLETAMPDRKGLTPADVIPYLISDIQKAYPTQTWKENGKNAVRFEQTTDYGMVSKEAYFDEKTNTLSNAEIFLDGQKLLSCTFSKFEFAQ